MLISGDASKANPTQHSFDFDASATSKHLIPPFTNAISRSETR